MKIRQDIDNRNMWINGMYMISAIATVLSSGSKYPDKPFEFNDGSNEENEKEIEENKNEVENHLCSDAIDFEMYAMVYNRKFK